MLKCFLSHSYYGSLYSAGILYVIKEIKREPSPIPEPDPEPPGPDPGPDPGPGPIPPTPELNLTKDSLSPKFATRANTNFTKSAYNMKVIAIGSHANRYLVYGLANLQYQNKECLIDVYDSITNKTIKSFTSGKGNKASC